MNKLWVVIKNELMRYFVSPLAYVYLLSFLILNASFAIYFGDFFNRGQADLLPMFDFQPWLYLLFIPGISMRLWAEEFRQKTIVQIITMPVSIRTLVVGKFLASWLFCGIALILTFPFWLTVNFLGTPDNSVIALGYAASFALAGCMLAISQTMSALTKNQVIALVLAVIANLFFFWSGIEYVLSIFRLFMPDSIIDVIASFSFLSHFDTLERGLLEARDIIFFASILLFFNFTTILIINFKTAGTSGWLKSNSRGYYITAWLMLLLGFLGLNIIANNLARRWQYDATAEKIWTLTTGTRDVLNRLPEKVIAKLYFSPELEQRNPDLRVQFDNVRILLQKYKSASNGKFDYKVYYPRFLSEEEDIALADGIQAIPLIDINQNALFGLTLEYSLKNKQVIPFFAAGGQGGLEQEITEKIYRMYRPKKSVGFIAGVPIFGSTENDGTFVRDSWEFVQQITESYDIFNIVKPADFDHPMDVLVLFAPKHMPQDLAQKIEVYARKGGKIIAILDPADEASRLYSINNKPLQPTDLGELESFFGIKFYPEYVVADLQNSITVDATVDYNKNPVFSQDVIQFKLPPEDMNPKHPITRNLHELMLASASVITPDPKAYEAGRIKFTPLLKAGDISSIMTAKVVIDGLNPQRVLQYFEPDTNPKILAAEVLGATPENPFELIVIGDSDFLYDSFWMSKQNFLEKSYRANSFDNANFLLNALDYLTYDQTLLDLRGKRAEARPFKQVEILRRLNSMTYKQKETAIFDEIENVKKALNEIWNKKDFEERDNFNADELVAISKVRDHLNDLRQQLSDLRYNAFKDVKRIADIVAAVNICLVPAIIILLLIIVALCRGKKKCLPTLFKIDLRLLKLSFCCLLLLGLSFASVWFVNRSEIDSYENRPAFPQVMSELNNINKLVLKNNQHTLTFTYENGLWKLAEMPDLPVYQARIRRLLTTIANATFFSRKSDKAENLATFNLAPIEDKTSKVTEISLFAGDTPVQSFYVGDINVDLGRGATAAYVRFADQFQVWTVKADFITMDLDWHNWLDADLWSLRYGRIFASENSEHAEQQAVILMKEMINTPIEAVTAIPAVAPLKVLPLSVEDGNAVTISFYADNGEAFAAYDFDKNNTNPHLQLLAQYLTGKAVKIAPQKMEKILDVLNR